MNIQEIIAESESKLLIEFDDYFEDENLDFNTSYTARVIDELEL